MKEYRLLCGRVIKAQSGRFVKWRVQQSGKPMEQLRMDIKYVPFMEQNETHCC
jgi:hypothetical protein